jgi:zinc protease
MKRYTFIFFGLLMSATLFAQYTKIENKESTKKNDPLMSKNLSFDKYELSNGLTVIINEDHSDPVVSIKFLHKIGSSASYADRTTAMYLISQLLYAQNESVDAGFYTRYGGQYAWDFNMDLTSCDIRIASDLFEAVLAKEARRLLHFIKDISTENFQTVIEKAMQESADREFNGGKEVAKIYSHKSMYPFSHPYSWLKEGQKSHLETVKIPDLKSFYADWFGANNLIVSVSGDVEAEEAIELVNKYFKNYQKAKYPFTQVEKQIELINSNGFDVLLNDRYVTTFSESAEMKNPYLRMVFPTVKKLSNESVALDIAATILSKSKSNNLVDFLKTAELAEEVEIYHETFKYDGGFVIEVQAKKGVSLKDVKDTIRYFIANTFMMPDPEEYILSLPEEEQDKINMKQIREAFQKKNFELNRMLAILVAEKNTQLQKDIELSSKKANLLANYEYYLSDPEYYADEVFSIMAVNMAGLFKLCDKYLIEKPAVVISVLPKGQAKLKAGQDNHRIQQLESMIQPISEEDVANIKIESATDFSQKFHKAEAYPFPKYETKKLENGVTYALLKDSESDHVNIQFKIDASSIRTIIDKPKGARLIEQILYGYVNEFMGGNLADQLTESGSSFNFYCNSPYLYILIQTSPDNLVVLKEIIREMFLMHQPINIDVDDLWKNIPKARKKTMDAEQLFSTMMYNRQFPVENASDLTGNKESDKMFLMTDIVLQRIPFLFDPQNSKVFFSGNIHSGNINDFVEGLKQWEAFPSGEVIAFVQGDTLPFTKTVYYYNEKHSEKAHVVINYSNLALLNDDNVRASYFNYALGAENGLLQAYHSDSSEVENLRAFHRITGDVHAYCISFDVDYDKSELMTKELIEQITAFSSEKADKKLLKELSGQYVRQINCRYESNNSKACLMDIIIEEKRSEDYFVKKNKIVRKTKGGKLKKFVSKNIRTEEMQLLLVGKKKQLNEKFENSGLGILTEIDKAGNNITKK